MKQQQLNTCIMRAGNGKCLGGFGDEFNNSCQHSMQQAPCEKSLEKYSINRQQTLRFLELHGMALSAADELLDAIEDGDCQFLRYNGGRNAGINASNQKYSVEQVREVCRLLQDRPYLSMNDIAIRTNVSRHNTRNIYRKKVWKHISNHYDFSERIRKGKEITKIHDSFQEMQL